MKCFQNTDFGKKKMSKEFWFLLFVICPIYSILHTNIIWNESFNGTTNISNSAFTVNDDAFVFIVTNNPSACPGSTVDCLRIRQTRNWIKRITPNNVLNNYTNLTLQLQYRCRNAGANYLDIQTSNDDMLGNIL